MENRIFGEKHNPDIHTGALLLCPTRGYSPEGSWFCYFRYKSSAVGKGYGDSPAEAEQNARASAQKRYNEKKRITNGIKPCLSVL